MKSKSVFLIVVSLGFGLVAAIGFSQVMGRNSGREASQEALRPVVLAVQDIDVYTELTEDLVVIEQWPARIVPEGVATSLKDIENKVVRSRVGKRFPIYVQDLLEATEARRLAIPAGYRVVAIAVGADDHIAGLLQPGHIVDVIGVFRGSGRTESTSKTFLRRVRVFSVDSRTTVDTTRDPSSKAKAIVGVLLTEKQAEQLALVQATAELKLALRGNATDEDDALVDAGGATLDRLMGQQSAEANESAAGFGQFMQSLADSISQAASQGRVENPTQGPFVMTVYTAEGPMLYQFDSVTGRPLSQRGGISSQWSPLADHTTLPNPSELENPAGPSGNYEGAIPEQ